MAEEFIDYSELVDEVMHIIVRKSLEIVSGSSFCGDHHFFISFLTDFSGVILSKKLKHKYPEEMTIVLQYQYEDLDVKEDHFSVTLSFDNTKERITVPFKALTAFADPSVKFGLQFRHYEDDMDDKDIEITEEEIAEVLKKELESKAKAKVKADDRTDNVITLDNFRKKR